MQKFLLLFIFLCLSINAYAVNSDKVENIPRFSKELLEGVNPIYQKILKHPFVKGLVDGSLSKEKFRYFLVQNDLYLKKFALSQALLATKAPSKKWTLHFVEDSLFALKGEREQYEILLNKWDLNIETINTTRQSPIGLSYSSYEFATIQAGSFAEGLAALLPCYVLYRNMGRYFVKMKIIQPPYKEWLYSYADENFGILVDSTLQIFDEAVKGLPNTQKQKIRDIFYTSCFFEWMFFEAAWNQQEWPKLL